MRVQKTEKARAELRPGARSLGQRERTMLLLADGQKSVMEIAAFFKDGGQELARRLLDDGYLAEVEFAGRAAMRPGMHRTAEKTDLLVKSPSAATPPNAGVSADSFEGKRSLATTRMFLFDIAERMFVRRDPLLAERFREALRHAKDRDTMLAVSREMLVEVEQIAGHERADSISERIAMLLPEAVT